MLDDAVAAFLDSVSERALDEPLLAVLRARGFTHVSLTHGQGEFGKDIVARRDGKQWAFQSKAGNIGQPQWRQLLGQLEELRLSDYGGPEFAADLPRSPVLITTGRLVGNAPLLASEYNRRARDRGEPQLEAWTRDDLLAMLAGNPDAVLRGSIDGALLSALGAAERSDASMESVGAFAARWDTFPGPQLISLGVVEASILCERLSRATRVDLACHLALCLVRAAWAGERTLDESKLAAAAGTALFRTYANALWDECDHRLLRRVGLVGFSGPSAWVTYPIRCMRIAEILGLLGLLEIGMTSARSIEIAEWLARFVYSQPGVAHPISDRYAVSLIPAVLLLQRHKPYAAKKLLTRTVIWVCDRYQGRNFGLSQASATPEDEINRAFGDAFEHVRLRGKRRSSFAAAVTLDLAALCRYRKLYADVRNDYLAVRLNPIVIRCGDGLDQYRLPGDTNRLEPNPGYPEDLPRGDRLGIPHFDEADSDRQLLREGRPWDLLAVSSSLRDRHFVGAMRMLLRARDQAGESDEPSATEP